MPAVEDFFRVVAHKVRARLVNRSSVDIPVRVAGVEVKSLGVVLEDSEYREDLSTASCGSTHWVCQE